MHLNKYLLCLLQKVLVYLSQKGVDTNTYDKNGDTPLHAYVRRKDKNKLDCLVAFLINAKEYDVDRKNGDGDTPLHVACKVSN